MKPFKNAESIQSAPTNYAPSVPMSVYRELAAELRANKAVIDSLNSRNQQLISQNQRLKKEIHNVVQATLSLGQFAGVARPAGQDSFPNAIGPDTLAKLVRAQGEANKTAETAPIQEAVAEPINYAPPAPAPQPYAQQGHPQQVHPQQVHPQQVHPQQARAQQAARKRVPQPIQPGTRPNLSANLPHPSGNGASKAPAKAPKRAAAKPAARSAQGHRPPTPARQTTQKRTDVVMMTKPVPNKLFTEQSGEYRSSVLDSNEEKEIGGIWLALSIILIIVTAFGAGFLIMKPLLNDR